MGDIRIKIECPNDKEDRPSINIPPEEDALDTFFVVDEASITMSHGEIKQVVEQPSVEIKIEDYQKDIQKKYFFLEWANCYWTKDKFKTRRLRKVTVQFLDENGRIYRVFIINSAFLAEYTDTRKAEGKEQGFSYHATIRSNEEKQEIHFLPDTPEEDDK